MTTATTNPDTIRHDLWAVLHWDHSIGDSGNWCMSFISTTYNPAFRRADAIRKGIWYGRHTTLARIVHPRQWQADGFCAAGNTIAR